MNIYMTKTREVTLPTRAHSIDAGIDFYMPKIDGQLINDLLSKNPSNQCFRIIREGSGEPYIELDPGKRILIPSGIKVSVPIGSGLIAANKSGLSSNFGIQFTAQVVDPGYTGEVHIGIINLGQESFIIKSGQKLIQFLHTPLFSSTPVEVSNERYAEITSGAERKEGGFGSTGN